MFFKKSLESSDQLADQIVQSADHALRSTERGGIEAFDRAAPLLHRASEQVSALAQRGVDGVRDTSRQLRDQAQRASDNAVNYIKDEPGKAMLIAAATTAALLVLVNLLRHPRGRR